MDTVFLTSGELVVVVSVSLILFAFLCWRIFYISGRGSTDGALTDGAVLLISDGMVQQASPVAVDLFGDCEGKPVIRVLDEFLDQDAGVASDSVNRLEMTGEPVNMLVHSGEGHAYELIGNPSGAMIRLVLRDAEFLDVKLRDAEQRISAADGALQERQWQNETLSGLVGEAPIIAWHRTANGEVNWSGGEIKVRNSSVIAAQAVDLIVARTKLNRQPVLAGQPQKSRIEIVVNDGAETVSLHVVEMIRQDGSRIGFATDAGTAASAERTLTRFVQTMTETFAHLTVGLAIFDRNQTLALFNPALVQMWQVEPAWLARRPSLRNIIDELRSTRRLPELQDFHKWRSRLLTLFENTEAADYEELWHLADGSNIRVLARPHPHGSLAFIFDDVTERVRLEQRYRHSIDLRRATLDRLTEGIAVFGANGLLQFVNQAFHETWGTDGETVYAAMHARQLVGLCEDLTVEADLWQRLHSFITGEESRRAWTQQVTMGSGRRLTTRVAPLPDGSTMAVFSDSLDAMATASTPQLTDLSQSGAEESESLEQLLSQITEQADSLATQEGIAGCAPDAVSALAEKLRSLTEKIKSQPGLTTPAPDDPDPKRPILSEALSNTAKRLSDRARAAEVNLSVSPDTTSSTFNCSAQRLRQVVFNLSAEAIRAAPVGGTVVLHADGSEENFCVSIVVQDGADPALADDSRPNLSIARSFAIRDGGEVKAEYNETSGQLRFMVDYDAKRLAALEAAAAHQGGKVHPLAAKST